MSRRQVAARILVAAVLFAAGFVVGGSDRPRAAQAAAVAARARTPLPDAVLITRPDASAAGGQSACHLRTVRAGGTASADQNPPGTWLVTLIEDGRWTTLTCSE